MPNLSNILFSFLFGVLGAIFFNVLHHNLYGKSIAVVSMDNLISEHVRTFSEGGYSQEDISVKAKLYSETLEQVIRDVSEAEGVTLMVSPAVVSDVPNYTDFIRKRVDEVMDNE